MYLSKESVRTLVHAFIIGRTDYCNSLLFGLPSVHLLKLQCLQNAAARPISNAPRYSHITPVLCSLHWLPVKFRIDLKILLLTFKAIYGHAPDHLIDLITIKEFRAIISVQLAVVLFHLLPLIYGTICPFTSFLRTTYFERLKSLLKKHLFRLAFGCNVFNLLSNIFSVFIFIWFLGLFTLSLNYCAHFSFYFLLTLTSSP